MENLSKTAKGTVYFTVSSLLSKGTSFLLLPIYLNYLSVEEYGSVGYIQVLNSLIFNVLILGLYGSQSRLLYDKKIKSESLIFTLNSFLLGELLLIFILYLSLGEHFFNDVLRISIPFYPLLLIAFGIVFFMVFNTMASSYFVAIGNHKIGALYESTIFVLNVLLILMFVVILDKGVGGYLTALLISQFLSFLIFGRMYLAKSDRNFSSSYLKESLLLGIPNLFHLLGLYLNNSVDRILLEKYLSLRELGVYNLGYQLASVSSILIIAANKAWVPSFYNFMNLDSNDDISSFSKVWMEALGMVTILGIIVGPYLIDLIAPKEYKESVEIMMIILFSYYGFGVYTLWVNYIFYYKKNKILPFLTLASGLLNLMLNIIMIPRYGIVGAALSTLVSFYTLAFLISIYTSRVLKRKLMTKKTLFQSLIIGGIVASQISLSEMPRLIINGVVCSIIVAVFIWKNKLYLAKFLNDRFSL